MGKKIISITGEINENYKFIIEKVTLYNSDMVKINNIYSQADSNYENEFDIENAKNEISNLLNKKVKTIRRNPLDFGFENKSLIYEIED